ncbi:anti-sigma B factor RsbT [Aquipluma nitroreducens]|uniref:Anti-sigma B factor RsbT n=1 Tax=Aquipluma nitroreducens TaxID=2010828 RepID=A0A5K7SBR9_9BACT|nr:anti-sigma regulatory factor [Aquipluma nitroreducens]BBE19012.1 anti-sigma B factor RsbT [Aquipluma nitroreducens]
MKLTFNIQGGDFTHAGKPSSEVKKVLKQLNVDGKTVKNIVIALYEAEVNVVAHAWKGTVLAEIDENKITIFVEDDGPGIPDIELAMQAGYSTASKQVRDMGFGAGMGLPNMKKNTDELLIESEVGKGTKVKMVNYFK